MQVEFTLELFDSRADRPTAWHPVLPARDLPAYRGRGVTVTEKYLRDAASETRRYYRDLEEAGLDYRRPILTRHERPDSDSPPVADERHGDLMDFEVREFRDTACLFVKSRWRPESWAKIQSGAFERGSIRIVPEYTDPQTGQTYGPFIDEFSVTEKPVIKDYRLTDTIDPAALAAVGLTLSEEEPMSKEQQPETPAEQEDVTLADGEGAEGEAPAGAGLAQALAASVETLTAALSDTMAMLSEIREMLGMKPDEEGGEEDEGTPEVEASEDVPKGADTEEFEKMQSLIVELSEKVGRMERASQRNTKERGTPKQGGKPKVDTALKRAREEGLSGLAAVNRAKELRGEA